MTRKFAAGVIGATFMIAAAGCSSSDIAVEDVEDTVAPVAEVTTTTEPPATTEAVTPEIMEPLLEVPDLSGLNEDQAFEVLRDLGLFAKFTEVESSEREGSVVLQTPRAGSEVEEGEIVDVRIAIPETRTIGVLYSVHDDLWQELEDGKCEHREASMFVGQSVILTGPNGESLATDLVFDGYVDERLGDSTQQACMFAFQFDNVPEVQSYGMRSATVEFPQVPLWKVIEFEWNISWSSDRA